MQQWPVTSRSPAGRYLGYTSIPDVETLKAVIASQYVASIGIDVYRSFESDEAAATRWFATDLMTTM
jgi:hypothetical protein